MDLLVVEDDDVVGRGIARLAGLAGFEGQHVSSVAAALEALAVLPRETVAVVDVKLRRASGLALIQQLRRRGDGRPVVLMSGDPPKLSRRKIRELGIASFLAKPFGAEKLKVAVELAKAQTRP